MIEIQSSHLQKIHQHAKASIPYECCGILIGRSQGGRKCVADLMATENAEELRGRDRYRIHGKDFFRGDGMANRRGLEIIGFYHSHPDGRPVPSAVDLDLAWERYTYLIVSPGGSGAGQFRSWIVDRAGSSWTEERIRVLEGVW